MDPVGAGGFLKRGDAQTQTQETMKSLLNSTVQVAGCLLLAMGLAAQAQEQRADVSGSWTWTQAGRGGGEARTFTLTLKADGEKLTGSLTSPGRQGGEPVTTPISDGKVKDDEISFKITRQRQTNTFVMTYTGKVSENSITGTVAFDRNGQSRSREWTAKRQPASTKE